VRIELASGAKSQLDEAIAYIGADDPAAALRMYERLDAAFRRVARYPKSGRKLLDWPQTGYREVIVHPFRVFYRCEGDVLWIVGVWHGAQRPDRPTG